jgi:hypothetical protein
MFLSVRACAIATESKYASRNHPFNAPPMKLTQRPGAASKNFSDLRVTAHRRSTLPAFV